MYLNQRCYLVLKTIIDNPSITGKKLEERLNLSRKQVSYTIDKINDYLEQNGFSKIERLRTGKFNIPLFVIEEFQSKEIEIDIKNYVFSSQERSDLLLLLLLSIRENLSSYHFTSALGISKNTLISDLKKLKNIIGLFNISLFYSRAEGYTLIGTELSKRDLLIYAIKNVLGIKNGESIILKLCDIKNEKLYGIKEEIEEIETKLNIRFTDKRLKELPYILYLIIRRIDIGRMLVELPKAFQHMKGTKEYSVVNEMTENLGISNPLEKMYLTAQIQVSNIHHFEKNKNKVEKNLVTVVKAVIEEFEKHCCIRFKEKDKLLEAFIQHCGPAVYRILYNYHIEPNITDMFLREHQYLHKLVKKSVAPLEALVGRELPDEELVYLTVLLGAWLRREGFLDFVEAKRRGVVVCTKGVSISNYLLITLKELFPEIEFIASLSVREFNDYQENYSIVFSTVRVKTEKTQFLVKPFLNDQEKQSFREKVFQELEGINLHTIQIDELIKIVREHSIIYNETKMEKALKKYISRS
ncbi:MAG: transcription antiterminator, partial [Clostridia bacterium]|nr:transcription antiterminator [Clostridia bacterium]